jgi:conjugal transfer pilus assembly protein TraA
MVKFILKNKWTILSLLVALLPTLGFCAATGGGSGSSGGSLGNNGSQSFEAIYNFVFTASTGYLGRSIAITGGIIGLGFGAAVGKAMPAVLGIVLAVFGSLGPKIINTIFETAILP